MRRYLGEKRDQRGSSLPPAAHRSLASAERVMSQGSLRARMRLWRIYAEPRLEFHPLMTRLYPLSQRDGRRMLRVTLREYPSPRSNRASTRLGSTNDTLRGGIVVTSLAARQLVRCETAPLRAGRRFDASVPRQKFNDGAGQ